MLTRLKVSGFKNLVDVDVRFGPFTCVAGPNGVGKSNLFDAIKFLSSLADKPLMEAALSVRDEGGRTGDVRSLFHRAGDICADRMLFEAEMIVPRTGIDDLGQVAKASITFLRYSLELTYRGEEAARAAGSLELTREELRHITLGEAPKQLWFPHHARWRKAAVVGERRAAAFISTEGKAGNRKIKIHPDGGSTGKPRSVLAASLPRTVLSVANAAESPTATLARREMQSWRLLQLEPSSLRQPDSFAASPRLGEDGSHLAAALYHLAQHNGRRLPAATAGEAMEQVYARVANRLSELMEDVREVWVDRDEKRELLTLHVRSRDRTAYPARALSDGTLRFLALTVLELDPQAKGLLCLEEPENGIHPQRIPAMLELLQDIVTDVNDPADQDNPLGQVIVNTHSPAVVAQVPDDSLMVAESGESISQGRRYKRLTFSSLADTWRTKTGHSATVARGRLQAYLTPVVPKRSEGGSRRVVDRPDLQLLLPLEEAV